VPIGQTFAEMWRSLDFSRWRMSDILDLLSAYLNHLEEYFVVLVVSVQNLDRIAAVVLITCKF